VQRHRCDKFRAWKHKGYNPYGILEVAALGTNLEDVFEDFKTLANIYIEFFSTLNTFCNLHYIVFAKFSCLEYYGC
jgi:hypothetical protein